MGKVKELQQRIHDLEIRLFNLEVDLKYVRKAERQKMGYEAPDLRPQALSTSPVRQKRRDWSGHCCTHSAISANKPR